MANHDYDQNSITIEGFLGNRGPELEYTPNGKAVTCFQVCTNHTWKDADGNQQSSEEWHWVKAWNGVAENVVQYLKAKGHVRVTGRMHYYSTIMKDPEGNEVWFGDKPVYRNFATIMAESITFLPGWEKREEGKIEAKARPSGTVTATIKISDK